MRNLFTILLVVFFVCFLNAQPTVNGELNDVEYTEIATKQNSNAGFGPNIDVTSVVYYPDVANSVLYFGIKGKLDTGADNAIGVWLNITGSGSPLGASSGTELGFDGAGHYMDGEGGGTNDNFIADFEVDYMFAFNPGNSATDVYWDAASLVGGTFANYQGNCDQSGTPAMNGNADGTVFSNNSITFAFNNGGGADQGLEMAIPFSEIGATSNMSLEAFTFIVSSTAFFSDVTVPGDITTGNPGFNTDFSTIAGGPFHSNPAAPLPVELVSFDAQVSDNNVNLSWRTSTETNNKGFDVERSIDNNNFESIAFIDGNGTTTENQTYTYSDNDLNEGTYYYRLKQIDLDGSASYSDVVEVEISTPMNFELSQNYPNPFNPSTVINYQLPEAGKVTLNIYNVQGKEVASLVNEYKEAGSYEVNFNASDLSSGVYFYRLTTGNNVDTKMMMLLK